MILSDFSRDRPATTAGWSPPSLTPAGAQTPAPEPAVDDNAEVRERAYNEGYAEGLAAGRAQGEATAAQMSVLLQAMVSPFQEVDAALLRELTALVERVCAAVLEREFSAGSYDIDAVLQQALTVLGGVELPVQLTLNPADAGLCRELKLREGQTLEIVEDPTLHRGGLRLKAGSSLVDASVESRLQDIFASLRDGAGLPDPEDEATLLRALEAQQQGGGDALG